MNFSRHPPESHGENLAVKAQHADEEVRAALIRGDQEANEIKHNHTGGLALKMLSAEEILSIRAAQGFAGPIDLPRPSHWWRMKRFVE